MSNQWQYQLRINLGDEFAELARRDPDDPAIEPLADILSKHRATMTQSLSSGPNPPTQIWSSYVASPYLGIDPLSWTPDHLGERSPRCREETHPIRSSFASRRSSWCMPAARRRSCRVSSSRRPAVKSEEKGKAYFWKSSDPPSARPG